MLECCKTLQFGVVWMLHYIRLALVYSEDVYNVAIILRDIIITIVLAASLIYCTHIRICIN